MSKFTPWYPPEIKPVRKGMYQRRMEWGRISNGRWDTKRAIWLSGGNAECSSIFQESEWRGLTKLERKR